MTYIVARFNALSMHKHKSPQLSSSLSGESARVKAHCHTSLARRIVTMATVL